MLDGLYNSQVLGCDFDSPTNPADSTFGDSTPLPLEGLAAAGDSGGGVFITLGSTTYLAGLNSFYWRPVGRLAHRRLRRPKRHHSRLVVPPLDLPELGWRRARSRAVEPRAGRHGPRRRRGLPLAPPENLTPPVAPGRVRETHRVQELVRRRVGVRSGLGISGQNARHDRKPFPANP